MMVVIISIFSLIFVLLNYYVGKSIWFYLARYFLNDSVFWVAFWSVAFVYPSARIGGHLLSPGIRWFVTIMGAYWLGALFYFLLIFAGLDLLRILSKLFFSSVNTQPQGPLFGTLVCVFVLSILIYGTWNARNPEIKEYHLTIDKKAGELKQLHIAMVSDVHLGEIIHNGRLIQLVEMLDSLQPDIVLLPGDLIDEDIGPFINQNMAQHFQKLKPKYGLFAVTGNHEFIGGHVQEIVDNLTHSGIEVLRDRYVKIEESFYVVGIDDCSHHTFEGSKNEKSLSKIMEGIDRNLPVILLNHQPRNIDEANRLGVDLQLSGHTHRGQFFPNQFITERIFPLDWGYLRFEQLQLIVSSGFGTWGPPIRIGNKPEIVSIYLEFTS